MAQNKISKRIDVAVFAVLLLAASIITFQLFYHQTTGSEALYHSDMKAYILEMQGLDSGYSFPYPVFFKLSAFFDLFAAPELAVAIATLVLNSGAMIIMKWALNHYALEQLENAFVKNKWMAGALISFVSISLFFISMLFPPQGVYLPGIKYNYLGVFSANPFHNATYMAARPFAILAFLWYVKLLDTYEEGCSGKWKSSGQWKRRGQWKRSEKWKHSEKWKCSGNADEPMQEKGSKMDKADLCDYVLFSIFLLLATMTKPSFTIVLVGAAGLIMLFRMFRSKFKNFIPTIQLGLTFIPTFIDLLYQYKGVFVPDAGEEGGMGFTFGKIWALYCDNIPLAICLAVGFPLAVLVLNYKELKTNTLYRFSWQVYLMSFAMAFLLYEKGFRWADFNFSWGYMYGIFFAFVGAVVILLRKIGERKKWWWLALQWIPLLWHITCGLYYFAGIAQGKMYY